MSGGSGWSSGRVEGGGGQITLLLGPGVVALVVFAHGLETLHSLFEFSVRLAALSVYARVMANVIKVDWLARDGGVPRVISLIENVRIELFLLLAVSVHSSRSCVDWLGPASICLPVGVGAHNVTLDITIVLGLVAIEVAAAEDSRLQVLELLFTSVNNSIVIVTVFHRRISAVGHLRLRVHPVTVRRHESTVALRFVDTVGGG